MLKIRFQRTGRRNLPTFRLVVADKAKPPKGKYIEIVGFYLPKRNPHVLEYKEERVRYWIDKGAIPSDSVARLLHQKGMQNLERFIKPYAKKKKKKSEEKKDDSGKETA